MKGIKKKRSKFFFPFDFFSFFQSFLNIYIILTFYFFKRIEFCRTNSREAPTFFEEPTEKRCWLVIGEQRFEQPPSTNPNSTPSLKEMKEKLSSRVLKHFVKELAASKQ